MSLDMRLHARRHIAPCNLTSVHINQWAWLKAKLQICRATIAEIRQQRWVAQDYKPCRLLQSMPSTELADFIFEENVQPQHISQVSCSLYRCNSKQ